MNAGFFFLCFDVYFLLNRGALTMTAEKQTASAPFYFDPVKFGHILLYVFEKAQPLLNEHFERHGFRLEGLEDDPLNIKEAYLEFLEKTLSNPQKIFEIQSRFWADWLTLWSESALSFMGGEGSNLYTPEKGDRRFKDDEWQNSFYFNYLKQYYIMASEHMIDMVDSADDLDEETRRRLKFFMQQFTNALAPTNFLFTNPQVLRETIDTNGENLIHGLENLLNDLERGHGDLSISTTDYDAFELGKNIATTPGKVIYQNELMQLIQYTPRTKEVHKTPLLIVPPWINKFYILDLQEKNSYIKYLVENGHTVFIISWVNPDQKLAQKRFEDYMNEGVIEALYQIETETGTKECNTMGYCLGGTLLSVTLAYLAAKKKDKRIKSATFLTTMVDFELAGDMKLFMDEHQLNLLDKTMEARGVLSAKALKKTFSYLRANDLIWSFVINNYLMGREPFPFDLLYWNDDATNMPAAMHGFYMRKCYQDNLLPKAGAVTMNSTAIDMKQVKTPCYFLSAKDDHIAPWKATYATTQLFSGPKTFTLTASGHVAGVINPPAANKYHFWSSDNTPETPDEWLAPIKSQDGSWWPHWLKWVEGYTGDKTPARKVGAGKLKPIEDAPGSYVKMKHD
jgi:polyhydroxyalkanoate synthase